MTEARLPGRGLVAPVLAIILGMGAWLVSGETLAPVGTTADGVPVDARGSLHNATFSICAIDPDTGEAGVAVTTRVPFVGRAVPWVRAGVGAIATQAWTVVEYGEQGLALLEQGLSPEQALERLLADDAGREHRQLGILDMQGRVAVHTGSENGEWAGSTQGVGYTVQGNLLVDGEVIQAVADHFERFAASGMPLAERLILALEAGQKAGGDRRKGYLQSAAIRVADPADPGRGGDHISLAIDVGEHAEPVAEMKRIYYTTARRLGYRSFSEIRGPDVVELKRMLHTLGLWRPELKSFPDAPELEADPRLLRTHPEALEELVADYRRRVDEYLKTWGLYDGDTMDAVDAFRQEQNLAFRGNPRGLVDGPLVQALRGAYYEERKAESEAVATAVPEGR